MSAYVVILHSIFGKRYTFLTSGESEEDVREVLDRAYTIKGPLSIIRKDVYKVKPCVIK